MDSALPNSAVNSDTSEQLTLSEQFAQDTVIAEDDSMEGSSVRLSRVSLQACYSPGNTPTVVMIHGGLGNRYNWRSQWKFLRLHNQAVLTYDLAGHGDSGRYRRYSIHRHRRDLSRLLQHFQIQNPVLCCHSYGVPIGLEWAQRNSATALIAIGGGTHDLTPWWEIPIVQFLTYGGYKLFHWPRLQYWAKQLTSRHQTEAIDRFFAESPLPVEPHPYLAMQSFWGYDGRKHSMVHPLLVITGENDAVFPPARGAELAAYFSKTSPLTQHLSVPQAGHLVMVEAADVVNQSIWQLLQPNLTAAVHEVP